jgi:alkyl hydroperoxide reductase 1
MLPSIDPYSTQLQLGTDYLSQLFLSDPAARFSKSIDWVDAEGRTGRYAIIIDHGKVTYAKREREKNVLEISDAQTILKNL